MRSIFFIVTMFFICLSLQAQTSQKIKDLESQRSELQQQIAVRAFCLNFHLVPSLLLVFSTVQRSYHAFPQHSVERAVLRWFLSFFSRLTCKSVCFRTAKTTAGLSVKKLSYIMWCNTKSSLTVSWIYGSIWSRWGHLFVHVSKFHFVFWKENTPPWKS